MAQWVKNRPQCRRPGFDPWVGRIPWRRERLPTPVFWPGEFHGLYIVHGVIKSQTQLSDFHFTLLQIVSVPEEENKKKGHEKILEEIMVENFPKMGKLTQSDKKYL